MTIAFQPEVGASSAPAFASLRRFLNASSLGAFPTDGRRNGSVAVGASWDFHRFEGYVTAYEAPARDIKGRVLRRRPGTASSVAPSDAASATSVISRASSIMSLKQRERQIQGELATLAHVIDAKRTLRATARSGRRSRA